MIAVISIFDTLLSLSGKSKRENDKTDKLKVLFSNAFKVMSSFFTKKGLIMQTNDYDPRLETYRQKYKGNKS